MKHGFSRMRAVASVACVAVVFVGCAESAKPYKTAPVSGTVKLDGVPLAGAHVVFMPLPASQQQSGPEAAGDANENGQYTLVTVFGDNGASLGKNRVMISTRKTELDPANPDRPKEVAKERIPGKYFTEQAPLYFDVPAAGSQAANFELTTK
jgi:hypothetical protein